MVHEFQFAAKDAIEECGSEVEMLNKVEKIKSALTYGTGSYSSFAHIILRLKRLLSSQIKETEPIETYDKQINRIQHSILEAIPAIKPQEILVLIEYTAQKGIIYLFCDSHGELIFRYNGKLSNGKPHGKGTAYYQNGEYFEGEFCNGLREGQGKLFDKSHRVLKEGTWKNDKFTFKDGIEFFPDIWVAAGKINGGMGIPESESQEMIIPGIKMKGLISFPISGDSMLPTFGESDIVICQELYSIEEARNDHPYVVFHDGSLVLKIVQKLLNNKKVTDLRLVSENYLRYPPYEIEPNEKTKIFKVLFQIKKHDR